MAVQVEPVFVRPGPLLSWFPNLFAALPWVIPAGEFAVGVPHRDMPARVLERFVIEEASYQQRDQIWAGIVERARQPATAGAYRVIALGVAAMGLVGFRNRLRIRTIMELSDVDADLAFGLLRRLGTIDLDPRNIGGRLIDSATGYARRRWRDHLRRPSPLDLNTDTDTAAGAASRGVQAALDRLVGRLAASGQPLDPADVELIALTRLDRHSMIDAAVRLDLPVEAAYKRRQRAERRIAALVQRRVPAPSDTPADTAAVSLDGATAAAAAAGSSTRRTPADPTTR